ncbi:helix-turn-helix domain-containing protein [Micromonospora mirobrigensis]|uniref:Helix-turn-helix domain-containing protein n=1 Tax=Micromonospora mirobrigensis TaxID=262898 RepID=A0A1C5AH92_9ACTN|nr:helix-turn-helix transcriptional regulator [Micromonospora mirobrigensis]SCF44486.1 Helix-turn-helix domain-containing protein [Micromonospora mirobrigensis]
MNDFGDILRQHRTTAGWSLRKFAELTRYDFGYLGQIERGIRPASSEVVAAYDRVLGAHGALETAYASRQAGDKDMRRRSVLQAMGALAAVPAVDRLVGWEALRQGLSAAVDVDFDEWMDIVASYGRGYYLQPHDQLMAQLGRDLIVLQHQLAADNGQRRPMLLRAAGHLSVIVALSLVAQGHAMLAKRWWTSAQRAADESGDAETRVLTRAWNVVNGCYDGRSPTAVVALSEEVLPLVDATPSAATCGLLAGHAQALSLAGRHDDAVVAVRRLAEHVDALPAAVTAEVESLWGWPEHRLRHTESWVYTHAGDQRAAIAAQERALKLYPASQARLRTQVQLHQAAALIRDGHIPDGLRMAADLLDQLPREQQNELVRAVARQVVAAVPEGERRRPVYGELVERVRT